MEISLDTLRNLFQQRLPGRESQLKMAPSHREEELKALEGKDFNPRLSAVMALFFEKNQELQLLLIRRSDYVGIHAGQIAFPGGRWEESDRDFEHTALRELHEEVGIHPDKVEVIGSLTELYVPPSNFLIKIFAGYHQGIPEYKPDAREVKEVIEIPLKDLYNPKIVTQDYFVTHGRIDATLAPCYKITDQIKIWGASAMVIAELLDHLGNHS